MAGLSRRRDGSLYTTVTPSEKERILRLIESDRYMNIPDFVRVAVREKLAQIEEE